MLYWNREAEALYGYGSGEALGRSIRQLHGADLSDAQWAEVLQRVRSGTPSQRRAERRCKDGRVVTVDIANAPLFDADGTLCAELTVARDVTELNRVERSLIAAQNDLETRLTQLQAANTTLEREVQERRERERALHTTNVELKETVNDLKWFNHESDIFSEMAEILQACRTFEEVIQNGDAPHFPRVGKWGRTPFSCIFLRWLRAKSSRAARKWGASPFF